MSDFNSQHNRIVWCDIPVCELDRAINFYAKVLNINVTKEKFGDMEFGVLQHKEGNGACLVVNKDGINKNTAMLLYFNVEGRIRDAVKQVTACDGKIIKEIYAIGPYGFRSIINDSEGNKIALHSKTDA